MRVRDKKGSISIFVLVGLLFMTAFLILLFARNINKAKILKEQIDIISKIYSSDSNADSYVDVYTDLRKKNARIYSQDNEGNESDTVFYNTSTVELGVEGRAKTFADKFYNYRIYGNSIQDGTPSPDSPKEIKSVGNEIKNYITYPYNNLTSFEESGITFNVNSDGTFTINGTTTAIVQKYIYTSSILLKAGTYTPRSYKKSGTTNNLEYLLQIVWKIDGVDKAAQGTFTLEEDTYVYVRYYIPEGVTFNNCTIKPILFKGSEASDIDCENANKYRIDIRTSGRKN